MTAPQIARVTDAGEVRRGGALFDLPPNEAATDLFLASPSHHLLFAYVGGTVVGMVSGVEMTHPDKGTEMFLYELGVVPDARRRGVGTALVRALAELAREQGCYGMWVLADADNDAALATYRRGGADEESPSVTVTWNFAS